MQDLRIQMNKILEVKEYDLLTYSEKYRNQKGAGQKYHFIEKENFDGLVHFIDKMAGNQNEEDQKPFLQVYWETGTGRVMKVGNYVGLIQLNNGFKLQILPKLTLGDEEDKTKKVLLDMLGCMKNFSGWKLSNANVADGPVSLYDIFIEMYVEEAQMLVKRGLRSAYVEKEDNLTCYRGKLQVSRQIRENMIHRERFCVTYEEFSLDCAENRIIKATLLKLQKAVSDLKIAAKIRSLLIYFDKIQVPADVKSEFLKVRVDRNSRSYDRLMQWSKTFLENKSFTCFYGKTEAKALLFPMEEVYENYVACKLKKHSENTWETSAQDREKYLFDTPRKFAIRPDIVLRKRDEKRCMILDTKWKILKEDPVHNYGIKSADMYQMYVYSKRYKATDIWLLYPMTDWLKKKKEIVYDTGKMDAGFATRIHIYAVDVTDIGKSIQKLLEKFEAV